MAIIPQIEASQAQIIEAAASKMARLLEEHFDEQGWREEERDRRVAAASAQIEVSVGRRAKSA